MCRFNSAAKFKVSGIKMKLKHQLCVGFGGMFLLTALVGIFADLSLEIMGRSTQEIASAGRKVELSLIIPGLLNVNRERALKTLFVDDVEAIRLLDEERARGVKLNDVYLQEFEGSVTDPQGLILLKKMRETRKVYLDSLAKFVAESKGSDRNTLMATVDKELGSKIKEYQEAYAAMSNYQSAELRHSVARGAEAISSARISFVITLFVAVFISFVLVFWILRSVLRVLGGEPSEAALSVSLISKGDLTQPIHSVAPNSLLDNLEKMRKEFSSVMYRLKSGTEKLVDFSEALANTSQAVAIGAGHGSEAASSIAASIEQMTVSITHLSSNASAAAQSTQDTRITASTGSSTVFELANCMAALSVRVKGSAIKVAELGRQSDEIRSIVGLIKSIADQTNLLALNAAIEAARAGGQGRGFAVVADEVRLLAQRTSLSTHEIANKIESIQSNVKEVVAIMDEDVKVVTQGEKLASQGADAISTICRATEDFVSIVQNISAGVNENSAASLEVARTVESIATLSAQNSLSSQDVASTANELFNLANQLREVTDKFRMT